MDFVLPFNPQKHRFPDYPQKIFLLTAPIANFPAYVFVTHVGNMALQKFLCPVDKPSSLPKVINKVYSELRETQDKTQDKGKKRGAYQKLSSQEKAMIGKYASEHGVASAVWRHKDKNLKESSIRDWHNLYWN